VLRRRTDQRGLPIMHTGLTEAAREVLAWDEERVWAALPAAAGSAAAAWRRQGRVGEDVADLVVRGLGPAQVSRLAGLGLDGEVALAWADAVDAAGPAAVDRVAEWLRVVPTDTAVHSPALLVGVEPREAARWLEVGFGPTCRWRPRWPGGPSGWSPARPPASCAPTPR
jgi:hypothetical protein